jgi:hypothetical protein
MFVVALAPLQEGWILDHHHELWRGGWANGALTFVFKCQMYGVFIRLLRCWLQDLETAQCVLPVLVWFYFVLRLQLPPPVLCLALWRLWRVSAIVLDEHQGVLSRCLSRDPNLHLVIRHPVSLSFKFKTYRILSQYISIKNHESCMLCVGKGQWT